ncbi:protein TRANSPORT INHIBITOR RESPONSE 1-like [Syzygium oleosum]|uniref:protein TRANSPORT INHIBITOR RESPONSE 1-like n=1 Tax=Syzygium oleosum TaxID=219896 RepID=UPI0011D26FAB|nr:protein TRANSPORT INHIBITOR RESPONSE 1-like [Syzygium oleosum]
MDPKKPRDSAESESARGAAQFPDEVLERVLSLLASHKDRSAVSLVSKAWYHAERWSRRRVFIGNCYSVTPEIVARRFPNIRSVTLKGKPRFSDFNLVPQNWGADIRSWLAVFADRYPFLEELRLKRMTVTDESLKFLALKFQNFRALSLLSCDGFSTNGLAAIATRCRNLTELDIQENGIDDISGDWLSCFPENFTSLEVLNFASLSSDVEFDALERLVSRCNSLKVLKVNRTITLDQLQRLLVRAPRLTELGTGSFLQELNAHQYSELERAFGGCKNLHTLSGLCEAMALYLPVLYPACANLTFLNLNDAALQHEELAKLLLHCPCLQRLWVLDTVGDDGLEAVALNCPWLEELRVFPANPFDEEVNHGVSESGFLAVSYGCRRLHYVLYFCRQMTNAAVATIVQNCPDFTHFRLCIMNPGQPDYVTNEPMDEAFGAVVKTCTKLQRLAVSGLLTDLTFEYIGRYAKNLETLSVAFAGSSDWAMQCVLGGCPKLRKLEIRDCPFGNAALLSGLEKYESMRSLWMSACKVTMNGCEVLARERPRLNVEVMKDEESSDGQQYKVYVYRTVAGPRRDAPPFVLTL